MIEPKPRVTVAELWRAVAALQALPPDQYVQGYFDFFDECFGPELLDSIIVDAYDAKEPDATGAHTGASGKGADPIDPPEVQS